ncbi:hypothetical protein EDD18DRAFT_1100581 [Armillaria luteobubalina]|uniref:CxC2-like cysteine cluster KDZ transposase-associated domain-containing protein n=1 Tax=Armillaria luteobubalina TaxID=153913 RepID=A0AA39QFQ5_9AGAR|nr:hypothetical protein EDD18DRAFT_1100581 [Armillaria luteobubalina]
MSNPCDSVPLRELGLQYQVGHLAGEVCPHPRAAFGNRFTIIDTNGIHDVALDFCSCMQKRSFALQLHGSWLFPATDTEPCTAVTTATLEQFQMLTFMGKISAYEYYHSLVHLTNNTGVTAPSDNFDAFICVTHKWSFIRLLKRAGIGNDLGGWKAAKPGSCAVECLACPRPGVNIPERVDPDGPNAWEDTLYIGMDANFRLERFNVSSEDKDPGLSKGLTYFVDTKIFRKHLKDFDKRIIQPLSSCSNHEAAKVDLRIGETQVEMDFGYLTTIRHFNGIPHIVTSYNIACQWSINLEERINIYGNFMQPKIPNKVYLVPKFHLPGHIKDCQEKYCMSFHIHPQQERWVLGIDAKNSINILEISIGRKTCRKIKDAVPKASKHEDQFKCFTTSLPQSDVVKWTEMAEAWEVDRNNPNPFARTVASKTEAAMHLQLAWEDAQDEMAGLDGDTLHTTSPKEFHRRRISHLNKELGAHSTDLQRAQVLKKYNRLRRSIESCQGNSPSFPAYSLPLYLPSSILPAHPCDESMAKQYYRDIIKRLTVLSTELGEWGWQAQLHVLEDSDVRRIADDEVGISEGNRTMSWIWYSSHLGDVPGGIQECLRIEWCKTRARAHRWREECKLLKVEMERVKCTLEYDANLWLSRAKSAAEGVALINAGEGAGAYAKRQAAIRKSIRLSFEEKWRFVAQWLELGEMDEGSNEDVFTTE